MTKKLCPFLCSLLSLLAVFSVGCGKKAQESKSRMPRQVNPQIPDDEEHLNKQELFCGSDRSCPDYLTKIAFNHKGKFKYCTGFLLEQDIVVTSSSCLPDSIRMKNMPCEKDAYFFFAEPGQKPTRVGCEEVVDATPISGKVPFLWRNNVAYLRLSKKINRRTVSFPGNRAGMNDMDRFYTWSIDQIDDHQGIIRKTEDCQPVHGSYFNPLSMNQSSPVITMAGCSFNEGNSGAPILDYRGKVRGIISSPVSAADIQEAISMRILERPLKPMIHVSNFACIPLLSRSEVLNENECNKQLNIEAHDLGQRDLINEDLLFKALIIKIEHTLSEKNRYLKLGLTLNKEDDSYDVKIKPKCFKDVNRWIGEFNNNKPFTFYIELPIMKIRKAMSEYGKIYAHETVYGSEMTSFQFKPSILRSTNPRNATVFMWTNYYSSQFRSVSESCDGSLL